MVGALVGQVCLLLPAFMMVMLLPLLQRISYFATHSDGALNGAIWTTAGLLLATGIDQVRKLKSNSQRAAVFLVLAALLIGAHPTLMLVLSLTAVSFGGGNSLLAGLERELVGPGVITPSQFAAGVALGQATPGPLAAFTTAIGGYAAGWTGAVAATLGLLVVSWIAVQLIARVPGAWFSQPAVRSGLAAVTPYAMALVLFLAYRIVQAGDHTRLLAPVGIMLLVMVGRMVKAPTAALMVAGITLGMLVQGTRLAGW